MIRELTFDSKIFEKKIGYVEKLNHIETVNCDYDYLWRKIDNDNIKEQQEYQNSHFEYINSQIKLEANIEDLSLKDYLPAQCMLNRIFLLGHATKKHLDKLREISVNYSTNHFKNDRTLDNTKADILMMEWITNHYRKKLPILVFTENAQILGYIALKPKKHILICELLATLSVFQNRGIGEELIKAAVKYAIDAKFKKIEANPEPQNHVAMHLYEKMGLRVAGAYSHWRKIIK